MAMNSTKVKILNAAEVLFAEQGFSETSMRLITSVAEVNLAAVNYHFGSKKDLIQSVIDRFFIQISGKVGSAFNTLDKQDDVSMREILEALLIPVIELDQDRSQSASHFMRLLGRAYTESQGHLKVFLREKYGHLQSQFTHLVHKANPELSQNEIFWRLHFMLGTLVFAMASYPALSEIAEADLNEKVDTKRMIDYLIPFLTASLQSDVTAEVY
jgi:AcrR family transcriptional regulator